jgi:AraC-like DNA-binding protein
LTVSAAVTSLVGVTALAPMSHRERILEVARAAGMDLERVAPRWPARGPHDLTGPPQIHRVRALWSALMRGTQSPGVPIRVARRSSIDDCSLLGLAAKTAADLRSALQCMHRYHALWTARPEIRLVEDPDRCCARVEVLPLEGFDLAGRCRREMIVANLVQFARDMAGPDLRPTLVHFAHAAPVDTREHEAFFGAPIRFESRFSGVELAFETLERPLLHADAALARFLLGSLEALAAKPHAGASAVEQRVLRAIRERLATGLPRLEEIARELGTSARSLRRHLEARGARFRDLLDAVRREVAEEQLAGGAEPVAAIAARLGFSEPSSFYRAQRRWTQGESV